MADGGAPRTGWLAKDTAQQAFEERPFPALTPAQR